MQAPVLRPSHPGKTSSCTRCVLTDRAKSGASHPQDPERGARATQDKETNRLTNILYNYPKSITVSASAFRK